jgi:DNA-directed RNA polymerase subunit RPC12/RpoP
MTDTKFSCPKCSGHIAIDVQAAGATVACPHCSASILVPGSNGQRKLKLLRSAIGVVVVGIVLGFGSWLVMAMIARPSAPAETGSGQGAKLVNWRISQVYRTGSGESHAITEEGAAKGLTFLIAEATLSTNAHQALTNASESYTVELCHLVMPGDERISPTITTQRTTTGEPKVDLTLVFVVHGSSSYPKPPVIVLNDTIKLPLMERKRVK